ncbi:hybrid sensor histidine kinase/response regulator [Aquaspirillum sp. LM1]|jgi:PAS domain S-box-containing protein|uniref:PAS-domain containing protein n=1 Tax=Aquaspirillum sp. LM1 TaxID=1938604 RepID=UPI000983FAF0|nr:PAS-domain containing protein [Aquaspirillum sp. LM1]AQR63869.1 hybrid sensor histidine kinase/response regulator [Aquaspirillum sp. LM1]
MAGESRPETDRLFREMVQAGLDLLDPGLTVFDHDLRMVAWNRSFLRLLDFPESLAMAGMPFEAFIRYNAERGEYGPGDVNAHVAERVHAARTFCGHYTERTRPNGRVLAIRGAPLPHQGFITLYTDITEQKLYRELVQRQNAELEGHVRARTSELETAYTRLTQAMVANAEITSALKRSEARLRLITDTIPAHIAYFDHQWTYQYANRGYARWFGWQPDDVVGQPIETIIGAQVFATVKEHVKVALSGQQVTYEYSMDLRDGRTVYARSTLVPEIDASGATLGCFVHSFDISEQRRTQAALVQAQKMEAIGQLTGGLAHDFNNMLTVVMGNLQALRQQLGERSEVGDYLDPAMQAAQRGVELIKRLLTFSRQQPLEPQPVEVNSLIRGMAQLMRRSLPQSITITPFAHEDDLIVMADPHQLENALLNLALNARDAMPNGGELRIESSGEQLNAEDAADIEAAPGEYVQITVSDNGIGMDVGTLTRVFEPFFTTKQFGMGSGLGMSMVYGFVKQSGGGILLRSRQARGTTVALLLPRTRQTPRDAERPQVTPPCDGRGQLVLLVEDNPEVRKVVRLLLTDMGYPVLEAENGLEAADMIENIPDIAILLSDIVMPGGMDGTALARFARRFRPAMRIVLVSGYAKGLEDGDAETHGFRFLSKPFTREALANALQDTLT